MPNALPEQPNGHQQRRDTYDWAVFFVAVLALVAAAAATWFTWEQAAVARDQEIRSLRAYLTVKVEPDTFATESTTPRVQITAENLGQTPAYRAEFGATLSIEQFGAEGPPNRKGASDCAYMLSHSPIGTVMGKEPHSSRWGFRISGYTDKEQALLASGNYTVQVMASACYQDAFGITRSVSVCRNWYSGWDRLSTCPGHYDEYD